MNGNVSDRLPSLGFPESLFTQDLHKFPLTLKFVRLLSSPDQPSPEAASELLALTDEVLGKAYGEEAAEALQDVHMTLFALYETSFANPAVAACRHEHSPWLSAVRGKIEQVWLQYEIDQLDLPPAWEAAQMSPESLKAWFMELAAEQTAVDREVVHYLENEATVDDMRTFVQADAYLNYRFFDALVLALLHYLEPVKCEISEHFWEEAGEGNVGSSHTSQFTRSLQNLGLTREDAAPWDDWRPFAGHNLYFCFGLARRHYFKALGSLAMPELFDVSRDQSVVDGFKRLGFDPQRDFEYYWNHVEADAEHGPGWLEGVILVVAKAQPDAVVELMTGAALRMRAMRHFNRYLADGFGIGIGAA